MCFIFFGFPPLVYSSGVFFLYVFYNIELNLHRNFETLIFTEVLTRKNKTQ